MITFTLPTKGLRELVATAEHVAPKRPAKPVLSCLRLSAIDGKIQIEATDLEIAVRLDVPSGVVSDPNGSVLLPAALFGQIVSRISDEEFEIRETKNGVDIAAASCRFELATQSMKNWPAVTFLDSRGLDWSCEVPSRSLETAIKRGLTCVGESGRFALCGICMELGGTLDCISTDGRVGAVSSVPVGAASGGITPVVPDRALTLIRSLCDESPVKLASNGNSFSASSDGWFLTTRLLEGRFPLAAMRDNFDYRAIEPIDVQCGPFANGIEVAALASTADSIGVDIVVSDGSIEFSSSTDIGKSESRLPVGSAVNAKIRVNPRLVLPFLRSLDASAPLKLRIKGADQMWLSTEDGTHFTAMGFTK